MIRQKKTFKFLTINFDAGDVGAALADDVDGDARHVGHALQTHGVNRPVLRCDVTLNQTVTHPDKLGRLRVAKIDHVTNQSQLVTLDDVFLALVNE